MKKILFLLILCVLLNCTGCGAASLSEMDQYRQMLKEVQLEKTAAPLVLGEDLDDGALEHTVGAPLVQEMARRESNPIALFLEMVDQGIYSREYQTEGFQVKAWCYEDAPTGKTFNPIPEVQPMVFGEEPRWEELMGQALRMSALVDDGVSVESALLNQLENGSGWNIAYSEKDGCAYSYYICYGQEYAYILAVYYRNTEVEVQSLWLAYKTGGYAGCGTARMYAQNEWTTQTAALLCSLEKLIAGRSMLESSFVGTDEFETYELPGSYWLDEWHVEITDYNYGSELLDSGDYYDRAELVNYRISK